MTQMRIHDQNAEVSIHWRNQKAFPSAILDEQARTKLASEAPWWTYALLNRDRWRGTTFLSIAQESRAHELWSELFKSMPLSLEEHPSEIEVAVRSTEELDNWYLRMLPWEFVVNSVLRANHPRELHGVRRIPVIRRWVHPEPAGRHTPILPASSSDWRVMLVLSAPGFISAEFALKTEEELLRRRLFPDAKDADDSKRLCVMWSPSFAKLKEQISKFKPHIVHFAGRDTHQTLALAEGPNLSNGERELRLRQIGRIDAEGNPTADVGRAEIDGFAMLADHSPVMHGELARIECVPYQKLPELFEKHPPALVCWNIYNSGSRIASLTVGRGGVGAAVGFQDFIDDGLAEEYFDEFYRTLVAGNGKVGPAHVCGLRAVWGARVPLRGAGIVFWTRPSRLPEFNYKLPPLVDPREPDPGEGHEKLPEECGFEVDIEVPLGLNYAQLHQRQYSAFNSFRLYLRRPFILKNLEIEVRLNGDDRELAYHASVDLEAPFVDLREKIQFPLTSPLARSCRESVVITLYVRVKYRGEVLHSETYVTRLLPADQWRFSEGDAHTLASFVFPRDAEIEKLMLAAQKYVRVLRDDAMAGFEGYQAETADEVDLQVRAVWATIVHEYHLGYINPPPAYSHALDSQRLRTPGMVLRGGWGTCVDLALLLAAALELVDIYPALFVLRTHAFAGYWHSAEARDDFLKVEHTASSWDNGQFSTRRTENGMFLSSSLEEIRTYIDKGDLVVLEATLLTTGGGFQEAMDAGRANLDDADEFEYMMDVMSARLAQITPLPLDHIPGAVR